MVISVDTRLSTIHHHLFRFQGLKALEMVVIVGQVLNLLDQLAKLALGVGLDGGIRILAPLTRGTGSHDSTFELFTHAREALLRKAGESRLKID